MEKRRRPRINESLSHLKTLILDALKKDRSRHSKLEKAGILEMTVKHFRNLQQAQMTAGFSECMNEVTLFLSTCEGVDTEVHTQVLGHVVNCVAQINAMHDLPGAGGPPPPQDVAGPSTHHSRRCLCPSPGARRLLPAAHPASCAARLEKLPRFSAASKWCRLRPVCLPHPQQGLRSQRPGHPGLR